MKDTSFIHLVIWAVTVSLDSALFPFHLIKRSWKIRQPWIQYRNSLIMMLNA